MKENKETDERRISEIPVIPLRGIVLYPGSILQFDVGRKKSIEAINDAMQGEQLIYLVAQKEIKDEEPAVSRLCKVGVVAVVRQVLKHNQNNMRVLVQGLYRAKISEIIDSERFMKALVIKTEDKVSNVGKLKEKALIRQTKLAFVEYLDVAPRIASDVVMEIQSATEPGRLADYVATNIMMDYEIKQEIICELNPVKRLEKVITTLIEETELFRLENDIHYKVKQKVDEHQKEYFLREQIKVIEEELGETESYKSEAEGFIEKLLKLGLSEDIENKLHRECEKLMKMPAGSHEATVVRNYIETCLALPWNRKSKININIKRAEKVLDQEHYGLTKVKERILEFLAVRELAPGIKGQIICLVGPPGVGKTSIAKSLAKAMGCKYVRVSLGGVRDEAEIRGHRRTYVGAMPGKIISALKNAGTKNPLLLLDEIDKLSNDFRGDPTSALLEVLDSEQNNVFEDHYIDLPFDLSEVTFITTANDATAIPAPLLDRMEVIELSSYTHEEKFHICKEYLIPKQMKKHGMTARTLKITDDTVHYIIDNYTREAGVRNLERTIASVMRKAAKMIVSGDVKKVKVDKDKVIELLGVKKYYEDEILDKDEVGVVNGLAWTSVGGQAMQIEVSVMEGTGKVELTGSLGDIMKESAKAAISHIRSKAKTLNIQTDFYKTRDIHIHVPEGAVPKDGPSAGITIATGIASALTNIPVKHDVAMTGEITLRGRVLPIGGLREKTMAAYRNKVKTVILPQGNLHDLSEVDEVVKSSINFVTVSDIDSVLSSALVRNPMKKKSSPSSKKATGKDIKISDKVTTVAIRPKATRVKNIEDA